MSVTISNLTATWANTAVEYTAIKMNVANNGSAAGSKLMDLQANGTSLFTVYANGSTTIGGTDVLTTIDNRVTPAFNRANTAVSYKGYVLANTQTFTSSGTWSKPPLANATLAGTSAFAIVQAWGGGASGGVAAGNSEEGGGGGGGGFHERIISTEKLADTVTVTIGLGGTAITTLGTRGNAGGTSSFGNDLFAFGGGGGGYNASGGGGGGGGGSGSVGVSPGSGRSGGDGGSANAGINVSATSYRLYLPGIDAATGIDAIGTDFYAITGANYTQNIKNGTGGNGGVSDASGTSFDGNSSTYGGGGGGAGDDTTSSGRNGGGASVWGGGGGGGGVASGTGGAGGISTYGGNGGAGSTGTAAATAGSEPGGGGGGSETGTSGAGANGRVIVYTFDLVL
jgi:hypothetical protein